MNKKYLILGISCFIMGLFIFIVHEEWIILNIPSWRAHLRITGGGATKKACTLSYYTAGKWRTETATLIWSPTKADNLFLLVTQWLSLMTEEKIIKKSVTLETVALNGTQTEVLLSFDHTLFAKGHSTIEKLMMVESLLRTIAANESCIKQVRLLVHHQPLADYHLDFTNTWPIEGYAQTY